mgnify:CR=1 FL=1
MHHDAFTFLRKHWDESAAKERPELERLSHPSMPTIYELVQDMKRSGWSDAAYCPKDGSMFLAWDPLNLLPYHCTYRGEWPDGNWDAHSCGDIWPARPVLWTALEGGE